MIIFVAIPVYDGKVPTDLVKCLLDEQIHAALKGAALLVCFLPSCSHPAMGRNQLAKQFLESKADKLFFLDSDVTFEPGDLTQLAMMPVDLVGGAYRFKEEKESYPVEWIKDIKELWSDENGLIEVETLPGGFLCISRNVFNTLKAKYPGRTYTHKGIEADCFFQMPYQNGVLCGEDSLFCLEWRKAGGKVYLDPSLVLTHWDFNKPYKGNIGNWLKGQTK